MSSPVVTDAWGIDDRYLDAQGVEHVPGAQTRAALIRAMGGAGDELRGAPGAAGRFSDVVVVRGGVSWSAPARGVVSFEDGSSRTVDAGTTLPVPLGYHQFAAGASGAGARPVRLIGCPQQCYLPDDLKVWGWAAQLYATRSRESWGIGDLADLRRLGAWARGLGAGVVMVNPLTAATPVLPLEASPYYPSSRRFRNPLYLRVEEVPGARGGGVGGDHLARLARWGRAMNEQRRINRDAVFALKMDALERCFEASEEGRRLAPIGAGGLSFQDYRKEQGAALQHFATFCALAEVHGKDWRRWPAPLRQPEAPAATRFAEEHQARVIFHAWLQWLLDQQLRSASAEIGIIQDLPIGIDVAGADAWCWQDILATDASVGAPPDEFNPAGQDWGLTPFVPHKLRAAGYQPFVETIRATVRYAAGLRIDHVMGLFRLFWIPREGRRGAGAYVRMRSDELLGIVALESQRACAFVVGEDLGTVEAGVREAMAQRNMLSYRLMFFEDQPAAALPALALSTVSTHDLPTVAGLWTGSDLERTRHAGVPQNEQGIRGLRDKLAACAGITTAAAVPEAIEKVYDALAHAPSRVLLATLDDALAVEERPNIPGAGADWPNWSVALPLPIEAIEEHPLPRAIAASLARTGGSDRGDRPSGSSA